MNKGVQLKSDSSMLEPDRPQHDRLAACVIAQQYYSATFLLLRFYYCNKKKTWHCFKNV
jgi:hypothetical protein